MELNRTKYKNLNRKGRMMFLLKERLVFLTKSLDVNLSAQITDQVYTAKGFGKGREELLRAGTQEIEILRRGFSRVEKLCIRRRRRD